MSYCPVYGRWISQDPLGYVDGLNLYQAYQSDPVNGTDAGGEKVVFTQNPRSRLPLSREANALWARVKNAAPPEVRKYIDEIEANKVDVVLHVVSGDPNTQGGDFGSGRVDLKDLKMWKGSGNQDGKMWGAVDEQDGGRSTLSALLHEVVEQAQKKLHGEEVFDNAHDVALDWEGKFIGSTKDRETVNQAGDVKTVYWTTKSGDTIAQSATIKNGDFVRIDGWMETLRDRLGICIPFRSGAF